MTYTETPAGLLIPRTRTAEFAAGSAPLGEVATTRDGRDITRGYVDQLPLLYSQDGIQSLRGGGSLEIYRAVLDDWQVRATLAQWAGAVVAKEWEVVPGVRRGQYSKAKAKAAADSLSAQLQDLGGEDETDQGEQAQPIAGLDDVTEKMLLGRFWGYAVAECLWAKDGAEVVLDRVKVRAPQRFAFAPGGALRLCTTGNPLGEPLPRRKFWSYATGAGDHDEPYGLGLAHFLYWLVYFKKPGMAGWLKWLSKLAQPTPVGTFPRGASDAQQARLLAAVRALQTDSGIIVPEGMLITLLEAARSATGDYLSLAHYLDGAISKLVLGHSAGADATPGRLGGEDLGATVRQDLIRSGADLVCDSFNVGPARWLTAWNYGESVPAPKLWRRIEVEQDLKPLAERDKIIVDMMGGRVRPTMAYLTETYGDNWEEVTPPPPPAVPSTLAATPAAPPTGTDASPPAAFAAAPDAASLPGEVELAALDRLATDEALQAAVDPLLTPLIEAAQRDPEAMLGTLADRYPAMDATALTELLTRLLYVGELWGRATVGIEADAND